MMVFSAYLGSLSTGHTGTLRKPSPPVATLAQMFQCCVTRQAMHVCGNILVVTFLNDAQPVYKHQVHIFAATETVTTKQWW